MLNVNFLTFFFNAVQLDAKKGEQCYAPFFSLSVQPTKIYCFKVSLVTSC